MENNQLNGSLPEQLDNVASLLEVSTSGNSFSDPIPSTFGTHILCTWRTRISRKVFSPIAFLHPFSIWRCYKSWTCMGTASTNLFMGTWHNSRIFRFPPSLAISFQVPSLQASEIRSIWRLSPRTKTSGLDLFLQSSDGLPNRMFCPGLSIIRPDRFPKISLFVTSWKLSICKEINGQVPSLIFRVSPAPSISRLEWEPTVRKPPC